VSNNYYLHRLPHEGACDHCALTEKTPPLHIAKSAIGSFMLRGYLESEHGPILSFHAWSALLLRLMDEPSKPQYTIKDEYGQAYTAADFITLARSYGAEARAKQFNWTRAYADLTKLTDTLTLLDFQGYSITLREFS
jgi:hypothetical protein